MTTTASIETSDLATLPPNPSSAVLTCAACDGRDFAFLFEKHGRRFWKCCHCGMQRQHPLPSLDELKSYYEKSYRDGMYQQFAAAREMKSLTAAARWQAVRPYVSGQTWLDVGCADGAFLSELVAHKIDAVGIDLSSVAVDKAKARGLTARCETIADHEPAEPYDVVSAFDVLEHVLDPRDFLAGLHRLVKPGGILVLSTPNLRSFSRLLMRKRWYFYIPEEHLFYFAPQSLSLLLQHSHFELLQRKSVGKPLTFDYSLTQFAQYNPAIYRLLRGVRPLIPSRLRELSVPMHIGEMLAIARRC
jgi:2-polyprenyl-3-methyl-5-hydroxy-6-metoxy-1,4-benzoquinol methylase